MRRRNGASKIWQEAMRQPLLVVAFWMAIALALRLHRLAEPVLRWDEGWSLAHASLSWRELWQVAAAEWHPPLYVAMLKLWLAFGKSALVLRLLSVVLGTLAVPLFYVVGQKWSGRSRVGVIAAAFGAAWPLLVYYGQVTRMYALAPLPLLAATWFMLRNEERPDWRNDLGIVISALVGLYTFYHTVWVLLGLWAYALWRRPHLLPRLVGTGVVVFAGYLPWLWVAQGTLQSRLSTGMTAGSDPISGTLALLWPALQGLAFTYGTSAWAALLLGALLVTGVICGVIRSGWHESEKLLLPLFTVSLSLIAIAYGAQASRWFQVRHLVPATAFFGLALAWGLDRLAARWWPLLPAAVLLLAAAYWPTSTRFVYEKMLEVVDPFDPTADYRYLTAHAAPDDLIFFNVLAKAGWYENLRRADDPIWRYAMRWEPIIEPMPQIVRRIEEHAARYRRLWFVLYQGSFGPNAELKSWLDENLYPAGGEWQGDTLYLAYAVPPATWTSAPRDDCFVHGIRLKSAQWTPTLDSSGVCAVSLIWETEQPVPDGYKVFVHLTDGQRPVAQHDGVPGAEARPTFTWQPGEEVLDRHGLFLPMDTLTKGASLILQVGLYDPETGQRLLLRDGRDAIELGTIQMADDGS